MIHASRFSLFAALFVAAAIPCFALSGCAAAGGKQSRVDSEAKIARVWTGYVDHARADEYEAYLSTVGISKFPSIPNNKGVQMLRRDVDDRGTEFTVISYWPSMDAIKAYAGENVDRPRALPRDAEFMIPPGASVRHYTIREWLAGKQ